MAYTILFRRGTNAEWTTANSILHLGELGYVTDTKKFKIGDGITPWNSLSYSTASLVNGKVPLDQLPDTVKITVYQVASYEQVAFLTAQSGDIAIVNDEKKSYIYDGSSWLEIYSTPDLSTYATQSYVNTSISNLNIQQYLNSASTNTLINQAIDDINLEQYATVAYVTETVGGIDLEGLNIFQVDESQDSIIIGKNIPLIQSASPNIFIYQNSVGFGDSVFTSASGFINSNPLSNYAYNSTAVGTKSMSQAVQNSENTAVGYSTLIGGGFRNVAIGNECLYNIVTSSGVARWSPDSSNNNVAVGYKSGYSNTIGKHNVLLGSETMLYSASGSYNIAIGSGALTFYDDGLPFYGNNSIAIGASATVSASSQIKLGNSSQTTVSYGSIQNTADERDKADITNTTLGLDFINALRPVDFKWNYREDYEAFTSPGLNKKRPKVHHGLIAQEVKQAADGLGKSFGGYDDLSVSGNVDIKMLGYQEFIPPIIKSIQQVDTRLTSAEGNLSTVAALTASVASLSAAYAELIAAENVVYETYTFSSSGTDYFVSASPGSPEPTMTLVKGRRYRFDVGLVNNAQPIAFRESDQVTNQIIGMTNNDPVSGRSASSTSTYIFYTVPISPPYSSIIYQSVNTPAMGGVINLVNP